MAKHDKHKTDEERIDEVVKDEELPETSHDGTEESPVDEHEEAREVSEEKPAAVHPDQHQNPFKRAWHWALTHKKLSIPASIVVLFAVLVAVPFTRYLLAGAVVKQTFPVVVVDAESGKPVSSATVRLASKEATTSGQGRAEIKANVGNAKLEVTKKYYETSTHDVFIPIGKPDKAYEVKLKARGRVVPIAIVNSISKKPVANVALKADDGIESKTDDDGKASLVVPADKKEVKVTLSGDGFNNSEATVTVTTEDIDANTLSITPSGKIYFLSNASGKIDLVKSNLDGTDRQTVLAGTGKEEEYSTQLFISRDQKYITLHSKRDGGQYPKLFLIEAANGDRVTVMDEGEATFNLYGWSNDRFIYKVVRVKLKFSDTKRESIKSYHAQSKKITTLVSSVSEHAELMDYVYNHFNNVYVLGEEIIYSKSWSSIYSHPKIKEKRASLESIRADGSQAKTIKDYPVTYLGLNYRAPGELTITYQQDGTSKQEVYKDGKATSLPPDATEEYPPIYLTLSASGNKAVWSERRDGKSVFFVGDNKGKGGKEIGHSDEFSAYGWSGDDYVLLTKKAKEIYIIPDEGLEGDLSKALKVTDYYNPDYYY